MRTERSHRLDDIMASVQDEELPRLLATHRLVLAADRQRYEGQVELTEALEAEARRRGLNV